MPSALVIDDNLQAVDSLSQMLRFFGIEPHAAYGPRAAMMILSNLVPDIIFLDVNMPGVDGFEVLGYLRRLPKMENTPVVFVTSDDQAETAMKVRKTGALRMVIKPASMDDLESALKLAGLL